MARCWTCGAEVKGGLRYMFTCPTCEEVEQIKKLRGTLESSGPQSLRGAVEVLAPHLEGLSVGLSEIASAIEWGFEESSWKLEQVTDVLRSIDKTLKTPGQTQANERRQIAEELRDRGVLDESEKFFVESLEANPLDYRTYIGLARTYLQADKFDKAKTCLEKSLPHAPKQDIDYKSYSYRLIGHIYFCEEDYRRAASALKTAIELSPHYYLGHYDYAQYCALSGDKEACLSSLKAAIIKEPIPLELAESERNFEPFKEEVENLLEAIRSDENLQEEIGFRTAFRASGFAGSIDGVLDRVKRAKALIEASNTVEDHLHYLRSREYDYNELKWEANQLIVERETKETNSLCDIIRKQLPGYGVTFPTKDWVYNWVYNWVCSEYRPKLEQRMQEAVSVRKDEILQEFFAKKRSLKCYSCLTEFKFSGHDPRCRICGNVFCRKDIGKDGICRMFCVFRNKSAGVSE